MKRTALFLAAIFLFSLSFIAEAKEIGPNVAFYDGQQLKWENGHYGYVVMFKSQLLNLDTANDNIGSMYSPQADACGDQSTYTLDSTRLPADAVIERAFLVWTAAQPIVKFVDFTDNAVHLEFVHESESVLNGGLDVVGREARLTDAQDFEFESFQQSDENGDRGFFTHRVDVTDFFKQIQKAGRSFPENLPVSDGTVDGMSLYGNYTVSGLDCSSEPAYLDTSTMVANWSLVLIYSSSLVRPRNIYFYHGVAAYQNMTTSWLLTDFTLPEDPKILMTFNTHEGDLGLAVPSASMVPESFKVNGTGGAPVDIYNSCNYPAQDYNGGAPFTYSEIFNSISSVYGLDPTEGESCIGGVPPHNIVPETVEYAVDMDNFYIDGSAESWTGQFSAGSKTVTITLGANQDSFFTNFFLFSFVNPEQEPIFDIPGDATNWPNGREKHYCSTVLEADRICLDPAYKYYYLIKVQNWGSVTAQNVMVIDNPNSSCAVYDSGTTEIASQFDENGNGLDWRSIPDDPSGNSPLANNGYLVADIMKPCDMATKTCVDSRLIRFRMKILNGCPKSIVIQNMAIIKQAGDNVEYHTNSNVPLKLFPGSNTSEKEPPKSLCGGENPDDVITDTDEDVVVADEPAPDNTTAPDTDTKKDSGCGCSLVF